MPADVDARTERREMVQLARFVGALGAFAFLSIGLVELLVDWREHIYHWTIFVPLGTVFLALSIFAGRIVERFSPPSGNAR